MMVSFWANKTKYIYIYITNFKKKEKHKNSVILSVCAWQGSEFQQRLSTSAQTESRLCGLGFSQLTQVAQVAPLEPHVRSLLPLCSSIPLRVILQSPPSLPRNSQNRDLKAATRPITSFPGRIFATFTQGATLLAIPTARPKLPDIFNEWFTV